MSEKKSHREGKLVYHLTHIDNLPSMVSAGLCPRRNLQDRQQRFKDVADHGILFGRAPHGLDAYVPFHFICRSPFDYRVMRSAPDRRFVLIAVYRSYARANGWRVSPRHPLAEGRSPELLSWDEGVAAIDWQLMDQERRDYEGDHDTKMVCMAEALSPEPVHHAFWAYVYAPDEQVKVEAERALLRLKRVQVNPHMFPKEHP